MHLEYFENCTEVNKYLKKKKNKKKTSAEDINSKRVSSRPLFTLSPILSPALTITLRNV